MPPRTHPPRRRASRASTTALGALFLAFFAFQSSSAAIAPAARQPATELDAEFELLPDIPATGSDTPIGYATPLPASTPSPTSAFDPENRPDPSPQPSSQPLPDSLPSAIPGNTLRLVLNSGRAEADVAFALAPISQTETSERYLSHAVEPTSEARRIITRTRFLGIDNFQDRVILRLRFSFDGVPGLEPIRIAVTTTARVTYSTVVAFEVAGIVVLGDGSHGVASGYWRRGVSIGPYDAWLENPIVVLPILAYPGVPEVVLASAFSISRTGPDRGLAMDAVPAEVLDLSSSGQACEFDVTEFDDDEDRANARFVSGSDRSMMRVDMPIDCSVGINALGTLLAVRLQPYLVGTFGFQLRLYGTSRSASVARGLRSSHFSEGVELYRQALDTTWPPDVSTALNMWFSRDVIPPPVFPNIALRLDPFGGEKISIEGVRNAVNPPRIDDLGAEDLFFRIRDGNGSEFSLVAAREITSTDRISTVTFLLPRLSIENVDPIISEEAEVAVRFLFREKLNIKKEGNRAVRQVTEFVDTNGSSDLEEVAYKGKRPAVSFASSTLHKTPACTETASNSSKEYTDFLIVGLLLPRYEASRFSEYKSKQLGQALGDVVGSLASPFQLARFDDSSNVAWYSVPLDVKEKLDVEVSVRKTLEDVIESGSFSNSVFLAQEDIGLHEVLVGSVSEKCKKSTADSSDISGIDSGALPWALGFGAAGLFLFICALVLVCCCCSPSAKSDMFSQSEISGAEMDPGSSGRERLESFGLHQGHTRRRQARQLNHYNDVFSDNGEERDQDSGRDVTTFRTTFDTAATEFQGNEQFVFPVDEEETDGSELSRNWEDQYVDIETCAPDPMTRRASHALHVAQTSVAQSSYIARDPFRPIPPPYAPKTDFGSGSQTESATGSGSGTPQPHSETPRSTSGAATGSESCAEISRLTMSPDSPSESVSQSKFRPAFVEPRLHWNRGSKWYEPSDSEAHVSKNANPTTAVIEIDICDSEDIGANTEDIRMTRCGSQGLELD